MAKFKAIQEFITSALEFQKLTQSWSPTRLCYTRKIIEKEEATIAVPIEWEARIERLERLARICLLDKKQVTGSSYALVKRHIPQATVFQSQLDQHHYLRINNVLFKLI